MMVKAGDRVWVKVTVAKVFGERFMIESFKRWAQTPAIAGRVEVDPKVRAFADWLAEHPNGIEDLGTLVSSARYSVERTAHPPEDHKRVDVCSDLVKRLRDAA